MLRRKLTAPVRLVCLAVLALVGLAVGRATACTPPADRDGETPAAAAAGAGAGGGAGGGAAAAQQVPQWAIDRARELGGGVRPEDVMGPHAATPDVDHPDRDKGPVRPALGGRVIMHIEAQPANLNYVIENSAICTFVLREIHAALLRFNWETLEQDLELATRMDIEDTLILRGGRGEDGSNILFGKVVEDGDGYVVASGSPHNPTAGRRVAKSDVESLQRGTVFTFELRQDALWHDGHPFDADDVVFSAELYKNPAVDCDEKRFRFLEIVRSEKLGEHAVRFFYNQQYFSALQTFNDTMCLLPSHLYDLSDPDNPDFKPEATPEEQGASINNSPYNTDFVGLGPYKLRKWERGQYIEAERFDGYFETDPSRRGYVDVMRWRYIDGDDTAFSALINEEVDIFRRVTTEDYFGQKTESELFKKNFYKTYAYVGQYGYTGWNMYRTRFADVRVRTALAHAFDGAGWVQSKYKGLAVQVTGPAFFLSAAYDHDVKPLEYDPAKAEELLAEAGWYDRTGDGIVDKNGEELVIEFLHPTGNRASIDFGQKLQESYGKIGVGVTLQPLEWASFLERILERDFDACNLAWVIPEPESDPKQIWHGSEAAFDKRSSNHSGYADPRSDELIDLLRVELDEAKRLESWHELHARIYELQPYMFGQTPPSKIAFHRKLRGVKLYNYAPGFKLRDMYFAEGTPGTRPLNQN
jgi:peptide/nickel transport system substrate-binding protein